MGAGGLALERREVLSGVAQVGGWSAAPPATAAEVHAASSPAVHAAAVTTIPSKATAYSLVVTGTTYYGSTDFLYNFTRFTPAVNFRRAGTLVVTPRLPKTGFSSNGLNPYDVVINTGFYASGAGSTEYATNTTLHRLFGGNYAQGAALDLAFVSANTSKGTITIRPDTLHAKISALNEFQVGNSILSSIYQIVAGEIDLQFSNGGRHVSGKLVLYADGYIDAGTAAEVATFQGNAR